MATLGRPIDNNDSMTSRSKRPRISSVTVDQSRSIKETAIWTESHQVFQQINQALVVHPQAAGLQLEYASIHVSASYFDPLIQDDPTGIVHNQTISLARFDVLRCPKDHDELFFPIQRHLYIRDDMTRNFRRFKEDIRDPGVTLGRRVLLGSPGTGKSLLFFLAAVWKATQTGHNVLYLRKAEDGRISIFFMFSALADHVEVYFRRLDFRENRRLESLKTTSNIVLDAVEPIFQQPYVFVDGPRHTDLDNAIPGLCEYFCTSGGYPVHKNGVRDLRHWVLDGWRQNEMANALKHLYNVDAGHAKKKFYLCGGCMRDAISSLSKAGKTEVKAKLLDLIKELNVADFNVVLHSTNRAGTSQDRLRMMRVEAASKQELSDLSHVSQIVDSYFVLDLMATKISLTQLFTAYNEAKILKDNRLVGIYYELFWHKWFQIKLTHDNAFVKSEGTMIECTSQLTKEHQYWVPSTINFPCIDSVIIVDNTLYALQFTVGSTHSFDADKFIGVVVSLLSATAKSSVSVNHVTLVNVVPQESSLALKTEWESSLHSAIYAANISQTVKRLLEMLSFCQVIAKADPAEVNCHFPFFDSKILQIQGIENAKAKLQPIQIVQVGE